METSKRMSGTVKVGDAAVEGLLNGVLAGITMSAYLVVLEALVGISPLAVLGYFDSSHAASPLIGGLTHIAVSGIYGVIFGMAGMVLQRALGGRMNLGIWLVTGIMYGALIFAIAQWVLLPPTNSPLRGLPLWVLATAHLLYGLVLAWLVERNRKEG